MIRTSACTHTYYCISYAISIKYKYIYICTLVPKYNYSDIDWSRYNLLKCVLHHRNIKSTSLSVLSLKIHLHAYTCTHAEIRAFLDARPPESTYVRIMFTLQKPILMEIFPVLHNYITSFSTANIFYWFSYLLWHLWWIVFELSL